MTRFLKGVKLKGFSNLNRFILLASPCSLYRSRFTVLTAWPSRISE